jgi:hypothetical protein
MHSVSIISERFLVLTVLSAAAKNVPESGERSFVKNVSSRQIAVNNGLLALMAHGIMILKNDHFFYAFEVNRTERNGTKRKIAVSKWQKVILPVKNQKLSFATSCHYFCNRLLKR